MFKRALVSTSSKTHLVDFLKPLADSGCEIVSTGGTSKFLRDNKIKVTEVAEVTGFPEMMDGRVRTLHPKIHMGLLARSFVPEDFKLLKEHGVEPFDLVVVNLYPFSEAVAKGLEGQELIEQIDIGGPSLLRAAAKSFERISVVCDSADYQEVLTRARENRLDPEFNKKLAAKVFAHCSQYDELIARTLSTSKTEGPLPENINSNLKKKLSLRYGENPHQKAAFYQSSPDHPLSLHHLEQLQGKELSFNNLLDLEAAVAMVSEFENPAAAIIKHNTPCGVSECSEINSAFNKAFEGDPISAFGGIVALNRQVNKSLAESLVQPFLECVVAPGYDKDALEIFTAKKNLRVLTLKSLAKKNSRAYLEIKGMKGGALVQESDSESQDVNQWKVVAENEKIPLTGAIKQDLVFAQRVVKHIKSNAIVVVSGKQTLGICGGQTNRVDSVRMALERVGKNHTSKIWVCGSDAFFPFRDSVDLVAKAGVQWIVQPGGSLRDAEVIEASKEHKIGMVFTGLRHFKH